GTLVPLPLDWAHALRFSASGAFDDELVLQADSGGPSVTITRPEMKGELLKVAGSATTTFGDFLHAEGSFSFERGDDIFVTPHGATTTQRVSLVRIGLSDARVFAGLGPPDSNGDDVWDDRDDAIGVVLDHVGLALALMSTIPAAPGGATKKYM